MILTNMINNMLKAHEYKNGDKVIIMLQFVPDPAEVDYTLIDLERLYKRPHEYGEIWVDSRNNVNEIGQKLIAEGLFDGLVENGLIKVSNFKFPHFFKSKSDHLKKAHTYLISS